MPKTFIDLTSDERFCDGVIPVTFNDRDGLSGKDSSICIGDELEIVLTIRQAITLFDVLDSWLNGAPVKAVGDIERRMREAVKEAVEEGYAIRAINKRPEEFTAMLYTNMKLKGLRFRLHQEP